MSGPGLDIHAAIREGRYKNTKPYARRQKNPTAWDQYQLETMRLDDLFRADLLVYMGMEPGPAADALLAHAWDKGHGSGLAEVVIEAEQAIDLLRAGEAAERARIRRELSKEINRVSSISLDRRRFLCEVSFKSALDRVCPEESEP